MRRLVAVVLIVLGCVRGAEALTVRDLIELSRAGLGEEVLLALIEVNRGVYAIDRGTLLALKEAGVTDRVIAALVRSGREQPAPERSWHVPEVADEPPPVVVIEHHHEVPVVHEVAVPVPVYVAVPTFAPRHRSAPPRPSESTFVPFQTGPPPSRPTTPPASSQYWGFGGQLRPDAWQPAGHKADPPKRKADPPKADPPKKEKENEAKPSRGRGARHE